MAQLTPRYDMRETTDLYITRSGEKSCLTVISYSSCYDLRAGISNIGEREVGPKRDSKDTDSSLYTEITTRHRH